MASLRKDQLCDIIPELPKPHLENCYTWKIRDSKVSAGQLSMVTFGNELTFGERELK